MTNEKLYNILSGITQIDTKQNTLISTISSTIGTGFNTSDATVSEVIAAEINQRQADHTRISGDIKYLSGQIDTTNNTATTNYKELTGLIDTEKTARIADDTYISGVIDVINGTDTTDGSFKKAVKDAYDELTGAIGTGFSSLSTVAKAIEDARVACSLSGVSALIVEDVANEGKKVSLKIDANDKVLSQSADGLKATFQLSAITQASGSTYASQYVLVDKDGNALGQTINIAKDQFLKSAEFKDTTTGQDYLSLTWYTADGSETTTDIPLSGLFNDYVGASGVALDGLTFKGVVDGNSESFLTVGADGFKLAGVQTAIDTAISSVSGAADSSIATAINDLDVSSVGGSGKVITTVEQTDGKISAVAIDLTAANVAYGTDSTVKAAIDTINADKNTSGSVDYKIDQYDLGLSAVLAEVETIKTTMGI